MSEGTTPPDGLRSEVGSTTAELALTLPVVIVILAVCVATLSLGSRQGQLWDVAGQSARGYARGDTPAAVAQQAHTLLPGVTVTRENVGTDLVCARVSLPLPSRLSSLFPHTLEARSCTLTEFI